MLPVSPQGGSETQNGRFPSKISIRLKKVCYKDSLCENCQQQSCKAFIGLSIRAKEIGGVRPLKRKFCIKWTFPWHVSSTDQCFQEIQQILYLYRNYYNAIWNY